MNWRQELVGIIDRNRFPQFVLKKMHLKKVIIWIFGIVILAAIIAAVLWKNPVVPSLKYDELETAVVDVGPVVKTVPASGIVEPENEVLLLSPESSIISSIRHGVGSRIEAGETIMRLDDEPIRDQIENIEDQIEVKRNNLEKTKLNAKNIRVDLDYNVEVKKLKIISIKSELADQEQLLKVGGISPAKFEKTKQELTLAEKDLETILAKNNIRLKQLSAEERGLKLQIDIQQKQLDARKKLLTRMSIRAPSSGIILELNGREGEKVNKDQMLIRMSDLTTFKIRASIEETYDNLTKTGKNVIVVVDKTLLEGKIGTISPTIKDEKIEFDVFLSRNNYQNLRPNMSVPLKVIEQKKDSALRVRKGEAFGKSAQQEFYFLEGDIAYLRKVETGINGDDYLEVTEGANVGETIIISETPTLRKLKQIEIKK
jgi:HlyD family secretion protein